MAKQAKAAGISQKLILFRYFLREFGFEPFAALQGKFADEELRHDAAERSQLFGMLAGKGRVSDADLLLYDQNISAHLERINRHRKTRINLKYYQYFSLLFTERYLDRYFANRWDFVEELNLFSHELASNFAYQMPWLLAKKDDGKREFMFSEAELNLIAYWQATGSGKTFTLHFNILQYRHYCKEYGKTWRNFILLTPNESLSRQHFEELQTSGIEADFYPNRRDEREVVKIIDIHKIKEFTRGGGVTVRVSEFGQGNAIFVDEGHKGAKNEGAWRQLREKMGAGGFTFEYSATFGQVGEAMHAYYGKSILFDYSYKHFYGDGYGKHYRIRNIEEKDIDTTARQRQYFLANLLIFAQQKLYFRQNREALKTYQVENPLLIFVGHTVNPKDKSKTEWSEPDLKGKTENEVTVGDVQLLLNFLRDVLEKPEACAGWIEKLVNQSSDQFTAEYRHDLDWFFIQAKHDPGEIYRLLLREVFHVASPDQLQLNILKNASGEIGLRVKNSEHYFGVINIGDVGTFKNRLEGQFEFGKESFTGSLFASLSAASAFPVNLLIGARKFIEGWNNYRVSGIGLINFGKSEGSQIIQLFGRGVRLRGKDNSLKRTKDGGAIDKNQKLVETLYVFGLNARYMNQFKDDLEKEGVAVQYHEVSVPVSLWKNEKTGEVLDDLQLTVLRRKIAADFSAMPSFELEADEKIAVNFDFRTKMTVFGTVGKEAQNNSAGARLYLNDFRNWIDWQEISVNLSNFKMQRRLANLRLFPEKLSLLFSQINLTVLADSDLNLQRLADVRRLQKMTAAALRDYAEKFYNKKKRWYEGQQLETAILTSEDEIFRDFDNYSLQIKVEKNERHVQEIEAFVKQATEDMGKYEDNKLLLNSWFFNHLYQPLLVDAALQKDIEIIQPAGLNDGEKRFVENLQYFVKTQGWKYEGHGFYLLRNATKSKGFGFYFESSGGFFPDFLLWIKTPEKQYLTFIDPHGLRNEDAGLKSEKIRLHEEIKKLSANSDKLALNSFLLSPHPFRQANLSSWFSSDQTPRSREEIAEVCKRNHVLEMQGNYMQEIVETVLERPPA